MGEAKEETLISEIFFCQQPLHSSLQLLIHSFASNLCIHPCNRLFIPAIAHSSISAIAYSSLQLLIHSSLQSLIHPCNRLFFYLPTPATMSTRRAFLAQCAAILFSMMILSDHLIQSSHALSNNALGNNDNNFPYLQMAAILHPATANFNRNLRENHPFHKAALQFRQDVSAGSPMFLQAESTLQTQSKVDVKLLDPVSIMLVIGLIIAFASLCNSIHQKKKEQALFDEMVDEHVDAAKCQSRSLFLLLPSPPLPSPQSLISTVCFVVWLCYCDCCWLLIGHLTIVGSNFFLSLQRVLP